MQSTKKELIKLYNEKKIWDVASCSMSMWNRYVIIEATDEWVFGYYQYSDGEKSFFKVQLRDAADGDKFFSVQQTYLKLSMFMKTNRGVSAW